MTFFKYSFFLLALLATVLIVDANRALLLPLSLQEDVRLDMAQGTSLTGLVKTLKAHQLLRAKRDRYYLVLYAMVRGEANSLQAGEYIVTRGMSARDLFTAMVSGKVRQLSVTLLEGWNYHQILSALHSHPDIVRKLPSDEPEAVAAAVGIEGTHPEGWFFPDTYRFVSRTSDVELLRLAYQAMVRVLDQEWQNRADNLPYATSYEALIMASIVEKETGLASERGEIAGVFVRRLQRGMLLQTDPTVIYGIGKAFDGNIRRDDLRRDTPYNTYTRAGLPPTPIAAAGRESIHAALHPAEGESLYFVSRGDGSHQFSKSLDEHNQAVRKYQLKK